LWQVGVRPGDPVGVCAGRSPALIAGILAAVRIGASYVPIDARYPLDRIRYMVEDSGVRALLVDRSTPELPPQLGVSILDLAELPEEPGGPPSLVSPPWIRQQAATACIVYTSGSTGAPKGILLTHRGIIRTVMRSNHVEFRPDDVVAQVCNTSFDPFLWELWGALLHGARLQLIADQDVLSPSGLADAFTRHGVTVSVLPTALLHEVGRTVPTAFNGLRELLFGGEAADPAALRAIRDAGGPVRLQNGYGPAEGTLISCGYPIGDIPPYATSIPIGRPVSNARVHIVDRRLREVPPLAVGEVVIGGPGVANGYHGRPALTAQAFLPDPFGPEPGARIYRSGDNAARRLDGELEFAGRDDNQVKVRGYRVEPGEVEAVLAVHPAVRHAVVEAVRSPGGSGNRLVGYVVPADPGAAGADLVRRLRSDLRERLPEYLVPAEWVALPELPLTPNGKVDRSGLAEARQRAAGAAQAGGGEPRNQAERVLVDLFGKTLGMATVGIHDHFLDLGGDSVLAIGLAARAKEAGIGISAQDVLQLGTPAELGLAGPATGTAAPQELLTGEVPMAPMQRWFLDRELAEPGHFSQAVLLRVPSGFSVDRLRRAVRAVLEHHDALRLRHHWDGALLRQRYVAPDEVPVEIVDHRFPPATSDWSYKLRPVAVGLRSLATGLQRRLGVQTGHTLAAAVFRGVDEQADRLFLTAHHLVVDLMSWEVLVADLEQAYRQLASGELALGAKSNSFGQWVQQLIDWAASPEAEREADRWRRICQRPVPPVPADLPAEAARAGLEESAREVGIQLDPDTTAALGALAADGGPRMHELLVAAVAWGYRQWSGHDQLRVDLEGHGRHSLSGELDLSRTVGWFTALYPVVVDLTGMDRPAVAAAAVAATLRQVPNGGAGYGALRQLAPEPVRSGLAQLPAAQLAVNYVGGFADRLDQTGWCLADEPLGPERSPRNQRAYPLAVLGRLRSGRLEVTVEYSDTVHRPASITRLAGQIATALRELAAGQEIGPVTIVQIDATEDELMAVLNDVDCSGIEG
jgi:amino acid adenylation domain-containing protein/non-ribosomal peptide synthase protein (TIGR01720 family)